MTAQSRVNASSHAPRITYRKLVLDRPSLSQFAFRQVIKHLVHLGIGFLLQFFVVFHLKRVLQHLFHDPRLGHPRLRSETKWIAGKLTLVISMLISRIVWLIWGSFRREFESFMISVDF